MDRQDDHTAPTTEVPRRDVGGGRLRFRDRSVLFHLSLAFGLVLVVASAATIVNAVAVRRVTTADHRAVANLAHARDVDMHLALLAKDLSLAVVQVQQWLTDISATRAAEGFDDGFDEARTNAERVREILAEFSRHYADEGRDDVVDEIAQIGVAFESYYEMGCRMAQAYIDAGPAAGNATMGSFDEASEALQVVAGGFVDRVLADLETTMGATVDDMSVLHGSVVTLETTLAVAVATLVALFLALMAALRSGVARPLARVEQKLRALGEGDLTLHFAPIGLGEIRALHRGLDDLVARLNHSFGRVEATSLDIAEDARGVCAESTSVREHADEQGEQLRSWHGALGSVVDSLARSVDHSQEADRLSRESVDTARRGNTAMARASEAIAAIDAASTEIAHVVSGVDEIAFQTNLLALNAAVEAARAGPAGAGFAVVAEEVRALALRSSAAARTTSELIGEARLRSRTGVELTKEIAHELDAIVEKSESAATLIGALARDVHARADEVRDVQQGLTKLRSISETTIDRASAMDVHARHTSELARRLVDAVAYFRIARAR